MQELADVLIAVAEAIRARPDELDLPILESNDDSETPFKTNKILPDYRFIVYTYLSN